MNSRGLQTGVNDTMHAALSGIFSASVMATMILSAVAYRGWFRLYALGSLAVVAVLAIMVDRHELGGAPAPHGTGRRPGRRAAA